MSDIVDIVTEKMAEDQTFLERVAEKLVSVFNKAVWTTAYVNDLPDSAFLHILPGGKKDSEGKTTPRDLRMFPYKDAEGKIDLPHLRNAIARIPQSNRIDEGTKNSLQARARKLLGGQKDSSVGLYKDISGQWWYLGIYSNKFEDRDQEILSEKSHQEYIQWLKDSGFKPIVTILHQPKMPREFWPAVFAKYEGDIPKLSAIVNKIYETTKFAEVERVMYVNGFTVVAAKVFADKAHIAEALSKESDLGMSHGFIVKEFADSIVNKYRTFEMSVLRRKRAANYLTFSLFAAKDENDMPGMKGLTPEDRQFLGSVYGDDVATALETGTKKLEDMLQDVGLNFKDFQEENIMEEDKAKKPMMDEETMAEDMAGDEENPEDKKPAKKKEEEVVVEEEKVAETEVVSPEMVAAIAKAFNLDELQAALQGFADAFKALNETVENQNKELADLKEKTKGFEEYKKSEDERIAAQITPSFNWSLLGASASKSAKNVVTEEEKKEIEKAAPVGSEGEHKGDAFHEFFLKTALNGAKER